MKVEVQELEACRRQLVVEAPEAEVAAAWEAAYGRVQRQARLPGFRRGKVPRALVRVHFQDEVRRAVAEQLIPEVYRRALREARLDPVEEPEVREVQLEEGQPLRFTAVVEVKPVIPLGRYRGVTVRHTAQPVTDEDVDRALAALRERQATLVTVNRPARAGDYVVVDYIVEPEGAPRREERGYGFAVGAGRVLPEMEEAVMGLAAGEAREVTVRFPEEHPREDLRGRTGRLRVRVVEVKEKELPPLDDELARTLGDHPSLEALRAAVRADLAAARAREERHRLEEAVVDALLDTHDFAVPEALVAREVAHRVTRIREGLARQGIDPDRVPWDAGTLAAEVRPAALRAVRRALLLEAIAEREEIAVGDADIEAEIERMARESGRAPQAVRALLQRRGDLEGLRLALREAKVLAFLVAQARVEPES